MIDARVEVRDYIPREGELRTRLSQAVRTAVFQGEGIAKRLCPKDTGALANSIQGQAETGALEGSIATDKEYGPPVEYGTGRMKAQPFMTPAADAVMPEFERAVASILRGIGRR